MIKKSDLIKIFIFIVSLNFLGGCNFKVEDNSEEMILINMQNPINENININIRSIVKLETTDSILIGDITTLDLYKDKLYLFDNHVSRTLYLFSKEGKFLNKIQRGNGPGEINDPWDFCINKMESTVLIWDQSTFNMNVYDLDLNYLKSINGPGIAIRNLRCLEDGSIFTFSQFYPVNRGVIEEEVLFDYLIYDQNIERVQKKISKSNPSTKLISINNPIHVGEKIHYISPMDNDVYEWNNEKSSSILRYSLGKYQITEKDLKKGYKFYRNEIKLGRRIGPFENLLINDTYCSVSFPFKDKMETHIYNRKKQYGFLLSQLSEIAKIPDCKLLGLRNRNIFIATVNAIDYKNYLAETGKSTESDELSEFDNQFILFFSIDQKF